MESTEKLDFDRIWDFVEDFLENLENNPELQNLLQEEAQKRNCCDVPDFIYH
jgi:hypothetical protein